MTSDISPIDTLPEECLREIFQKLKNPSHRLLLEQVCHRWKNISRGSWTNFKQYYVCLPTPTFGATIIRSNLYLKHLYMKMKEYGRPYCRLIAEHCPNLQSLCIDINIVNKINNISLMGDLAKIFQNSPSLRSFKMHGTPQIISSVQFRECLQNLPKELTELVITCWRPETPFSMDLSKFTYLEVLVLDNLCFDENDLPGLEYLTNLSHLAVRPWKIHYRNIEKIMRFTNLKALHIVKCGLDDHDLKTIVQNNENLEELDISHNEDITDESFKHVKRLPNLKWLAMDNVINVTGMCLNNMPQLKGFRLHCCPVGVDDAHLPKLCRSSSRYLSPFMIRIRRALIMPHVYS